MCNPTCFSHFRMRFAGSAFAGDDCRLVDALIVVISEPPHVNYLLFVFSDRQTAHRPTHDGQQPEATQCAKSVQQSIQRSLVTHAAAKHGVAIRLVGKG